MSEPWLCYYVYGYWLRTIFRTQDAGAFIFYILVRFNVISCSSTLLNKVKVKVSHYKPKASWASGRSRLPDLLDIRHYEGGKVVTLTHRPPSPPGISWYSFLEAKSTSGHMELSKLPEKILSETTKDRSRDPLTCSAASILLNRRVKFVFVTLLWAILYLRIFGSEQTNTWWIWDNAGWVLPWVVRDF